MSTTIFVWALLLTYNGHGMTVIDNIATQDECVRIQEIVQQRASHGARCIQILKVK